MMSPTTRAPGAPGLGYREFIALMALSTSVVALAIDAVMPALPLIGDALGLADPNRRQLVIGTLFLGFSLSQLVFGPISDSFGRKPVMLAGSVVFMVGCVVSIAAPTFEVMLAGRFLQGVGGGGPRSASTAAIRDRFSGAQMARTMSLVSTIFIVVPVLAPSLGLAVLTFFGWRAVFWLFLSLSFATAAWTFLRLDESLAPASRRPFTVRALKEALGEVVGNRVALGYLFAGAFVSSGFIGYLSSAQQLLGELYGLGPRFPIAFGALAASIGLSSFVNSRLVVRFDLRRVTRVAIAVAITLASALLVAGLAFGGKPPLWLLFVLMVPTFFCQGMLFGNVNALAMQPLGHVAGMASAVIGAGSTLLATLFGSAVGQAWDGTIVPFAAAFAGFFLLAAGAMHLADGGRRTPALESA